MFDTERRLACKSSFELLFEIAVWHQPSNWVVEDDDFGGEGGLLTVPRRCFFCGSFLFLCLTFVSILPSCLFPAALWSLAGKGLTSCLSFV